MNAPMSPALRFVLALLPDAVGQVAPPRRQRRDPRYPTVHQGERECARRRDQLARGVIR